MIHYLRVAEVASLAGVTTQSVREAIERGTIPAIQAGRGSPYRILVKDANRYVRACQKRQARKIAKTA